MAAGHNAKFGAFELAIFLLALITGTSCSLCSKALLGMKGIGRRLVLLHCIVLLTVVLFA